MQPIPLKPDAGAVARAERRLMVRAITAMTLAGQPRRPPTSSSRPGFSRRRSTARGLRTSRSLQATRSRSPFRSGWSQCHMASAETQ
jgi:hypothetical protein